MPKQTVSERYQMIQAKDVEFTSNKHLQNQISEQAQQAITLCNQLHQALLTAQQSVQQMQMEHPENHTTKTAAKRMKVASQLLQQLKSTIPKTTFPISQGTSQQLKQLEYQINKANGTLQTIQKTFEASIST